MQLEDIDRGISDIIGEMKFFSFLTPVNREEEERRFFESLSRNEVYDPVFCYREFFYDLPEEWMREAVASLDEDDPMHGFFLGKMEMIGKQHLYLLSDDARRPALSEGLYGLPGKACLDMALDLLEASVSEGYIYPREDVTPAEMVSTLGACLQEAGIGWKVALSSKIVPKITVSPYDRTIYVNSNIAYTRDEVERLKVHEIAVHVTRAENGARQGYRIFREGLAGYDETEEALAILAEKRTGCLEKDTRQMRLYAARALATEYSSKGSFYETFKRLSDFLPDDLAYRTAERVKRGLRDTSRPGGLTRGHHYLSGWIALAGYLEGGGDLEVLYAGKISTGDAPAVKRLIDEGALKRPAILPDFIKD